MAIDPQRLDEIIAEFKRQHDAVRARLTTVTSVQEIGELVRLEFSKTSPDAGRVRVFVINLNKAAQAGGGAQPEPVPPEVALTEQEMAVVRARLPELQVLVSGFREMVADTVRGWVRTPAAPRPARRAAEVCAARLRPGDAEARAWLRDAPGGATLGESRFDAAGARDFVDGLYAAGAERVVVASECIDPDPIPPRAHGLRVVLPTEPEKRSAVLAQVNAELESQGFEPEPDRAQQVVFLWWDPETAAGAADAAALDRLQAPGSPNAPAAAPDTAGAPAEAGAAVTVQPEDPEALAWLRQNPGEAPLGANRFDAAGARGFVESLYRAGAPRVVIASECIRDDEDPPYADGMRVVLPHDPDRRGAVLDLVNRELMKEGFDPEPDRNQEVVFLWWD